MPTPPMRPPRMGAYHDRAGGFRPMGRVADASGILHWDPDVMLQPGSAETRGEQAAELDLLQHALTTDPAVGDLLGRAEQEAGRDDWQRANLAEMRRAYRHATAVPAHPLAHPSKAGT